jgi:hypothetical protein
MNTTNLSSMFSGCYSFSETVVAGWPLNPVTRQLLLADLLFNDKENDEMSSDDDDDDEMSS